MFNPNTVFIVGAGASSEFGLPVGKRLAEDISRLMYFEFELGQNPTKGDGSFYQQILRLADKDRDVLRAYQQTARQIHRGITDARSIDEYLYRHNDNAHVAPLGKLAIIYELLMREQRSKLFASEHASSQEITKGARETWISEFAHQLFAQRPAAQLDDLFDGIAIICFNYDRCIQRYLIAAVQDAYHVDQQEAQACVDRLTIIYPYGTIAALPGSRASGGIAYGAERERVNIVDLVDNIRTFTESSDSRVQSEIEATISEAKTVVFLGFGFHKQNLEMLHFSEKTVRPMVFATALKISDPNAEAVKMRLARALSPERGQAVEPHVDQQAGCAEFMAKYSMRLMQ